METPKHTIRKVLFRSPTSLEYAAEANTRMQLMFDHDVYSSVKTLQKKQEEERLHKLRDLLKDIEKVNWKYPSIDSLLGLKELPKWYVNYILIF